MRISDWSSDVCSSDLKDTAACGAPCPSGPSESAQYTAEIRNRADALFPPAPSYVIVGGPLRRKPVAPAKPRPLTTTSRAGPKSPRALRSRGQHSAHPARQVRSEERRLGKEGVSTCRSRWPTEH